MTPNSLSCEPILKYYYRQNQQSQINLDKKDWILKVLVIKDVQSNKTEINIGLARAYSVNNSNQEYKSLVIKVIEPDSNMATFSKQIQDAKPVDVRYPQDFKQANPNNHGIYTIIWEIDQKFLTCHQLPINESINN